MFTRDYHETVSFEWARSSAEMFIAEFRLVDGFSALMNTQINCHDAPVIKWVIITTS